MLSTNELVITTIIGRELHYTRMCGRRIGVSSEDFPLALAYIKQWLSQLQLYAVIRIGLATSQTRTDGISPARRAKQSQLHLNFHE